MVRNDVMTGDRMVGTYYTIIVYFMDTYGQKFKNRLARRRGWWHIRSCCAIFNTMCVPILLSLPTEVYQQARMTKLLNVRYWHLLMTMMCLSIQTTLAATDRQLLLIIK